MKKNNKINEKREELKKLSQPLKKLKQMGLIETINEGLINLYKQQGHEKLNTLKQWNKLGFKVNKGEHALLLWAQKKHIEHKQEDNEDVDVLDFWPLCYVFSNKQVNDGGNK